MIDRERNFNGESFSVHEIIPTSDHCAIVYFKKNTGKIGLGFFYYIPNGKTSGWKYFFPTDSHINGMSSISFFKLEVERLNGKFNT